MIGSRVDSRPDGHDPEHAAIRAYQPRMPGTIPRTEILGLSRSALDSMPAVR